MSLTIEDGSGVENADSYATIAELSAFAAARGFTDLPAADADKEILLRLGFDFIEAHRSRFRGTKANTGNTFAQFPREDLAIDGEEVSNTTIPQELKKAQMQLAMDAIAFENDLSPTGDGRIVVREKVDVLETEYAAGGSPAPQPVFTKALQFLNPLLKNNGMLGTTLRV